MRYRKHTDTNISENDEIVKVIRNRPDFTISANMFFETLTLTEQEAFHDLIKQLNKEIWNYMKTGCKISQILKDIKNIVPYERISQFVDKMIEQKKFFVPKDLEKKFVEQRDGIKSRNTTYLCFEYVDLMKLGMWIQIILPSINKLIDNVKITTGDSHKEIYVAEYLKEAWDIHTLPAWDRLHSYIKATKSINNHVNINNRISSEDVNYKLTIEELLKTVAGNNFHAELKYITTLYINLKNRRDLPGTSFGYVHDKRTANAEEEGTTTATENLWLSDKVQQIDIEVSTYWINHNALIYFLNKISGISIEEGLKQFESINSEGIIKYLSGTEIPEVHYALLNGFFNDYLSVDLNYVDSITYFRSVCIFHFILKLRGFHKLANLIISRKGEDLYIGNPKKNQTNDGYTLKGVSVLNTTLDEIIGSIASYRWIMMDGNDVDMVGIREEIEAIYI